MNNIIIQGYYLLLTLTSVSFVLSYSQLLLPGLESSLPVLLHDVLVQLILGYLLQLSGEYSPSSLVNHRAHILLLQEVVRRGGGVVTLQTGGASESSEGS